MAQKKEKKSSKYSTDVDIVSNLKKGQDAYKSDRTIVSTLKEMTGRKKEE